MVAISLVMVATLTHAIASPPTAPEPMQARDLPLLASEGGSSSGGQETGSPTPDADFAPLARSADSAPREAVRQEKSVEFSNGDGTGSVVLSQVPVSVADGQGGWVDRDTRLVEKPGSTVAAEARGEVEFSKSAADLDLVRIAHDGTKVTMGLVGADRSQRQVVDSIASYRDALPGVDLTYEVKDGAVKESLSVKTSAAVGEGRWVFRLDTGQLTPKVNGDTVELADVDGKIVAVLPPIQAWDAAGANDNGASTARTGGTYTLARDGGSWLLTVGVDAGWLKDPARTFPIVVDPTFSYGFGGQAQTIAYKQGGAPCTDTCGIKTGVKKPIFGEKELWRSALRFDLSSLSGRTITGARLELKESTSAPFPSSSPVTVWKANSPLGFGALGDKLAAASVSGTGTVQSAELTAFFAARVAAGDNQAWFMLTGDESGSETYKDLQVNLIVEYSGAVPAVEMKLVSPADDAIVATEMPMLQVAPVGAVPEGTKYCFKVSTGFDGRTGSVAQSGCVSEPKWTVPRHVLQDGTRYTWTVELAVPGVEKVIPAKWLGHFTVNERLGDPGPTPTDTLGPVTVNLFNGNLRYNAAGPIFEAMGGPAGVTFAYNSRAAGIAHGVRASYFNDPAHNGVPDTTPVLVRSEPQVALNNWLTQGFPVEPLLLPAGLKDNWYVVRWEGYFQAPAAGNYTFGGPHTDGAKVWLNQNLVYDNPQASTVPFGTLPPTATRKPIALTSGQRVPIKVELYHHSTDPATMSLWVEGAGPGTKIVQPEWLYSADPAPLPPGWTMAMPASPYTRAELRDGSVVLTDGVGAKYTWAQSANGGYVPPSGRDGVVAFDADGRLSVTQNGVVSLFNPDGTLAAVSNVADSKKPASLQYQYSGSPSRLTKIIDPVSGRFHTLHYNTDNTGSCYGGASLPKGANLPPRDQLCRITYWDGTQTLLWYALTTLARIENPGGAIQDLSYDNYKQVKEVLDDPEVVDEQERRNALESLGPLVIVRGNLGADWTAYQNYQGNNVLSVYTTVAYGLFTEEYGQPPRRRAITVNGPADDGSWVGSIDRRNYAYNLPGKTTTIDNGGIGQPYSIEQTITWDDAGRTLTSTNALGETARAEWNAKDKPTAMVDSTGRRTTLIYDHADRLTDQYGPAPQACFDGQLPKPECASKTPHTRKAYDENLVGLEAAFYNNPSTSGVPTEWATGVGTTAGTLKRSWGSNPPVANTNGWSARFTGEIKFPETGEYKLGFTVVDGVRLWIDDVLTVDSWTDKTATAVTGTYTNTTAGSWHRVRADYYNRSGTTGELDFTWTLPGTGTAVTVPGQNLRPRYGLETSKVSENTSGGDTERAPSTKVATNYADLNNGIDPVFGLAVSKSADPGGLNLTSRSLFEKPGQGFLRQLAAALPAGDLTNIDKRGTSTYYGDSETRANPCEANSAAVHQGGRVKTVRGSKNSVGVANVLETVYDAAGRIVALRTNTEPWSCIRYDARSRVATKSFPAMGDQPARTITYDYAVGGDPRKLKVSDVSGSTTTMIDLRGQVTSYTDASGNITTSGYDAAGRKTKEATTIKGVTSTLNYFWDNASRLTRQDLDGVTIATPAYQSGTLTSVAYGNSSNLAIGHNDAGSVDALTWTTAGSTVVSAVTRSRDQRITDEKITDTTTPDKTYNSSYTYDGVGRLIAATVPFHQLAYSYATDNGCGPNKKAGLNTNRTTFTDSLNGAPAVATNYCYDDADRLLSTNGATNLSFTYDNYGNTIKIGTDTLGYDSTLRHISTTTATGRSVTYTRDVTDRIIGRSAQETGKPTEVTRYGFTSDSGGPDFILDSSGTLRQRVLKLPGGAVLTKNYTQNTTANWSYPNVHGDILFTTDDKAVRTSAIRLYDPYGQNIDPVTGTIGDIPNPATAEGGMDFGWLGQNTIPTEHLASQQALEMGARTYLPVLGRFLQADPVPGGSANNYEYCNGDPINNFDLTGKVVLAFIEVAVLAAGAATAAALAVRGMMTAADSLGKELAKPEKAAPAKSSRPDGKSAVTGEGWDHIKADHTELGGNVPTDRTKGIFEGTEKTIRDNIAKAIEKGYERHRTDDRREFEHDFGLGNPIGREGPGNTKDPNKERTAIRVVVDKNGKVVTAHPI
ncbi:PA14 domain-containing protein [Nocardia sp. NPDC052566]|uniref:PA14 domain-containing protein n=1 Tax=Nocardia sp. NPDC052566 TaxID=3364330 RepID=UPI0037C9C9F4